MADARRHDLHQNFAGLGAFQVEFDDFERLFRFESDGSAGFHGVGSSTLWCRSIARAFDRGKRRKGKVNGMLTKMFMAD
jgi:hypothetical protein